MPNNYEALKKLTEKQTKFWKETRGISPDDVADRLDDAALEWLNDLTQTLQIWIDKDDSMTDGELILARANLGSVVESWLKFFYTVYYDDYSKQPATKKTKSGNVMIEPKNMSFDQLKQFSIKTLCDNNPNSKLYIFIDSVQHKRNAIHSFNKREIGTPSEFLDDIDGLYDFVNEIADRFKPREDYVDQVKADYIADMQVNYR